jgi:hypothetical protein
MPKKTLRKLARAHADGSIDKETYRKARAELIQGILSDEIPLKEINYPPLVQPPEPESLDDTQQRKNEVKKTAKQAAAPEASAAAKPDNAEPAVEAGPAASSSTNKLLYIGLAVAVLAIIVVALVALSGGDSSKSASTTAVTGSASSEKTKLTASVSAAQNLIREFLQKNNWSASSLDNFQQQWAELDTTEAMDSLELGQLTNAIYKQLLEERALSGLVEDDSSLNKQRLLLDFASALGITDARLSSVDEAL